MSFRRRETAGAPQQAMTVYAATPQVEWGVVDSRITVATIPNGVGKNKSSSHASLPFYEGTSIFNVQGRRHRIVPNTLEKDMNEWKYTYDAAYWFLYSVYQYGDGVVAKVAFDAHGQLTSDNTEAWKALATEEPTHTNVLRLRKAALKYMTRATYENAEAMDLALKCTLHYAVQAGMHAIRDHLDMNDTEVQNKKKLQNHVQADAEKFCKDVRNTNTRTSSTLDVGSSLNTNDNRSNGQKKNKNKRTRKPKK